MAVPGPTGFHSIGLVARDAGRTSWLYGEVLGLRRLWRQEGAPRGGAAGSAAPPDLAFGDEAGSAGSLVTFTVEPAAPRGRSGIGGVHHPSDVRSRLRY
jgi:glyoxalase family protein